MANLETWTTVCICILYSIYLCVKYYRVSVQNTIICNLFVFCNVMLVAAVSPSNLASCNSGDLDSSFYLYSIFNISVCKIQLSICILLLHFIMILDRCLLVSPSSNK